MSRSGILATALITLGVLVALGALIGVAVVTRRPDQPAPSTPAMLTAAQTKDLFLTRGCVSCHDLTNPLVGPSFARIAERYHDQPDAVTTMIDSLRSGSQGRWGTAAMPVQRLPEAEADAMIRWILAQRPEGE